MTKKIIIDDDGKIEIMLLKKQLQQHKEKYAGFKSFIAVCDDALKVADALLNSDYKTFKMFKLKITKHTAEKMRGIDSLSTYKKTSKICGFLSHHDCICKKCYAEKSIKLYNASLLPVLIYNTLLLKYIDLDNENIPYINNKYFRFESFSDLQGSKHLKNLIAICKKNKNTIFTLWTKAGYTLIKMLEEENINKLPSNLNIICSDIYIDKNLIDEKYLNTLQNALKSKNALKCFCVFSDKKQQESSKMFICKNKCVDCLKCYKKSKNAVFIAEKLH